MLTQGAKMKFSAKILCGFAGMLSMIQASLANPYHLEHAVPKDSDYPALLPLVPVSASIDEAKLGARKVLRVRLDWKDGTPETFALNQAVIENSGTDALLQRASR